MDKINFRPAIIADLPILYKFEQGIVVAERPFDSTLKNGNISYYDIEAMIKSNNAEVMVALIDNQIVASGYAKIMTAKPYLKFERYAYIGFMYVVPEQRGKGISSKILEQLSLWVKSNRINEIQLDVYHDNISAVKAYEKYGFKKNLLGMRMKI